MMTHIAGELVAMAQHDLKIRDELSKSGKLSPGYNPDMEKVHRYNASRLEEIIDAIGYPSIEKVGREASDAAWLIVQHAISEPNFMKKCYNLLSDDPNASPKQLAYLYDRLCYFEGRPQRYGTQFDKNCVYPIENLEEMKLLRKELQLEPRDEALIIEVKDKTAQSDLHRDNQEFNRWRKKVGWI
ncbi:DUF6624 domain-containing protein [Pedobacter terrae]|uniref:DUF6624 domain-containing protein n=1 Tax=Pedobacter terrae TaxID=405671 RepID=UPI002FF56320